MLVVLTPSSASWYPMMGESGVGIQNQSVWRDLERAIPAGRQPPVWPGMKGVTVFEWAAAVCTSMASPVNGAIDLNAIRAYSSYSPPGEAGDKKAPERACW